MSPSFSLAYCTNFWTPHQEPVCRALAELFPTGKFHMCLADRVGNVEGLEERAKLGWSVNPPDLPWIVRNPSDDREFDRMVAVACEADVAVLGQTFPEFYVPRLATGKLTFVMSERYWKKPRFPWRFMSPRRLCAIRRYRPLMNHRHVHYLTMGAYAAADARSVGLFDDRIWNWAYFTSVANQPPQPRQRPAARILWVGRMLDWKRVDTLIRAAGALRDDPAFDRLDFIGDGPARANLVRLAQKLGLGAKCTFGDSIPIDQVRQRMRDSDIYVLPSDRYEGWGAVCNEAMSEGCVLVASRAAGAPPVLIDHGRTGFLFQCGQTRELVEILRSLLHNPELCQNMRQAAWLEMNDLWHPNVGAQRLAALSAGILGIAPMPAWSSGPCARSV